MSGRDTRPLRVDVGPFAPVLKQLALDEKKTVRDLLWEILEDDERIAGRMPPAWKKERP